MSAAVLSEALRETTRDAHTRAESAPFVADLLGGRLPLSAYTAMVAQNLAIYRSLEAASERWQGHPVAGAFVLSELTRAPHLEADLAVLLGAEWPAAANSLVVPATERYVQRLRSVAAVDPAAFIAHHYVRYLGDLSGGQVLRQGVSRTYGDVGSRATAFYTFSGIQKIKPFRDRYRQLLDAARLSPDERQTALREAPFAFALNHAVFVDLASAVPVGPPSS